MRVYTSVDIGSDTIKVIVCEFFNNKLNLLTVKTVKTLGIKKGLIVDVALVKESLMNAIQEVNKALGIKIDRVLTNVPSYLAEFSVTTGTTSISEMVSSKDIVNSIKNAYSSYKKNGYDILTFLPIDFKVDGRTIKDPRNIIGSKLEVRGVIISLPEKNIYSVIGLFESIGIKVVDISINGLSNYYALKERESNLKAGLIVDIGKETTNVSLFNKGIMIKDFTLQLGGDDIDNDIAYIYRLEKEDARTIKEAFSLTTPEMLDIKETYNIVNKLNETVMINKRELSEIINSRVEQILGLIKNKLNDLANKEIGYIIISGGTSNVLDFQKLASKILEMKCSLGKINIIGIRENRYSVALGNILYFIEKSELKGEKIGMLKEEDEKNVSSIKKGVDINIFKTFKGLFDE